MKNLIFILAMFLLASCSKDEENCKCDVEVAIVSDANGIEGRYTIVSVPSDCNNEVNFDALNLPSNHWFVKTKNCN